MALTQIDVPDYAPDVEATITAGYQARRPTWTPAEADPDVVLIAEFAYQIALTNAGLKQRLVAELEVLATRRGRPRRLALPATGQARFVVRPGFVVPSGTQLAVTVGGLPDGLPVVAQTLADAGGDPGQTLVEDVPVQAVLTGPDQDGAVGMAEVVDQFDDIASAEITTALSGGQVEEDADAYIAEVVDYLQLFYDDPTIVNARQMAIFLQQYPAVARVLVLNLHVPAGARLPDGTVNGSTALDGVPGAIGAYMIGPDGEPPAPFVRDAIAGDVEDRREAGMILGVGLPTYTSVDVAAKVTTRPAPVGIAQADYDASVIAAVVAAIRGYLDPSAWGRPVGGDPSSSPGLWRLDRLVRYGEVYALVDGVDGVDHVEEVRVMGTVNANYTLAGAAPLPRAGAVTASVAT